VGALAGLRRSLLSVAGFAQSSPSSAKPVPFGRDAVGADTQRPFSRDFEARDLV
jgi:hypothetical protein